MNTLLEKLNLTEECKVCLKNAKLVKIVGNREKTNYTFYIEINNTLSIENYKEFVLKLKESFASIENVNVVFNVLNENNDLIINYVKECLIELSSKSAMLKLFLDSKIQYEDD